MTPPEHIDREEQAVLGFWLYLMSDCVLFAGLFAVFVVLRDATAGGASGEDFLDLPLVLVQTLVLLASSFSMGLALLAAAHRKKSLALLALAGTLALGLIFLGFELSEFRTLILEGNGPARSAFLSSFFTLVGTHGLHIALGSVWMLALMAQLWRQGFERVSAKLRCLGLFWHFLDLVWIFIFTLVYLFSAL